MIDRASGAVDSVGLVVAAMLPARQWRVATEAALSRSNWLAVVDVATRKG